MVKRRRTGEGQEAEQQVVQPQQLPSDDPDADGSSSSEVEELEGDEALGFNMLSGTGCLLGHVTTSSASKQDSVTQGDQHPFICPCVGSTCRPF